MFSLTDQDQAVAKAAPFSQFFVTDSPAEATAGRLVDAAGLLSLDLLRRLEASEPCEARGLACDEIRLVASYRRNDHVIHSRFREMNP